MSYDLAVWEGSRPADNDAAADAYEDLCNRYLELDERLPPTGRIRDYVEALLARWPDLGEEGSDDSPWAGSPILHEAVGPVLYLTIVWTRAEDASSHAAELARAHGLVCYDPQLECLRS